MKHIIHNNKKIRNCININVNLNLNIEMEHRKIPLYNKHKDDVAISCADIPSPFF